MSYYAKTTYKHIKRPCLRCGRKFYSTGPAHRMCFVCRAFIDGANMDLVPLDCGHRKRKHGSAN